ncbi:MAG: MFS transporter [bacterium]|nr:MFS transporter [bacterium]
MAEHPRAAFALLGATQVSLIATITLITLALPTIQRELGISRAELALLSAAYGLSFSGLLLFGGRLADVLGPRLVLGAGVAVFGLASGVAALSPTFPVLIFARFSEGVGAALAAPAALALVGSVFPDAGRRARAFAVWGVLAGIGAISGTLLGGAVVSFVAWRWTFALPAATATVALFAAPRVLPPGPAPQRTQLDVPGALLATVGTSALSYGLLATLDRPPGSVSVVLPLVGGATLLGAFVAVERRTRLPLVPLSLLGSWWRATALVAVLLAAAGTATMTFFSSLYFQQSRGLSPLETSAALVPYALILLATGFLAPRVLGRLGPRATTAVGLFVGAGGLALLSQLTLRSPYVGALLIGLLVFAVGVALTFSGATVAALEGVADTQAGVAGGVVNTALETGPTVGLAVLVSLAGAHAAELRAGGSGAAAATVGGYGFALAVASVAFAGAGALATLALGRQRDPAQIDNPVGGAP